MKIIEGKAFEGCSDLEEIVCEAINPPTLNDNAFPTMVQLSTKLKVPSVSLDSYKNSDGWKNFSNISAIEETVASGTCGDALTWRLTSEEELIIEGIGKMEDFVFSHLHDPDTRPWVDYLSSIRKVTIKEGVTSIGEQAFAGCVELKSVSISSSGR